MFDDNEIIINRFTEDTVDEILRQGDIVFHDLIRHNLSHIKHKFKITQDGNYGEFTFAVCLRNGKTEEQMELQAYIATNPKYHFNLQKLFISPKYKKVYCLWGYKRNEKDCPFILVNVNDVDETILMDEENVIKYFT